MKATVQGTNVLQVTPSDGSLPPRTTYNLSGDRLCVALLIRRDGKKLDFFCHLKPYTQERGIALMRDQEIFLTPAKELSGAVDRERIAIDPDRRFFDEHKIAVVYQGKVITDQQLDSVDTLNNIRFNAVNLGLLAIDNPEPVAIEGEESPDIEALVAERPAVLQEFILTDDDQVERTIQVRHIFRAPSAADASVYQKTQKMRTLEGGSSKIITKHADIAKLYDGMILEVEGALVDPPDTASAKTPEACNERNQKAWIPRVPYALKRNAIQRLFRGAERKNG